MIISKQDLLRNKPINSEREYQSEELSANQSDHAVRHFKNSKAGCLLADSLKQEKNRDNRSGTSIFEPDPLPHLNNDDAADRRLIESQDFQKLDREQIILYITRMEKARSNLIILLVQTPASLIIFADQYLHRIEQGFDQSEMFSLSYGKHNADPVQDYCSVQVNAKQFGAELDVIFREIIATDDKEIYLHDKADYFNKITQIHFLPVFLQQVATRVFDSNSISQLLKTTINKQLSIMLESRQIIINSNVRMVAFIVNKYVHSNIAFSDVMQEGTIGLIKAVDRFDYKRPVKFSTYAVYWIRQMISRTITKQKKLVCLPFNLATKISSVFSSINSSLQENYKWPSVIELAESCQLSVREIESILEFYQPCISLFSHVNNDEDFPLLLDTLEQQHFSSPLCDLTRNRLHNTLKNAINSLPEREAYVIRTRFGINNGIERTLQDIANQFHVSKERIRQIQNVALSKLREQYGAELSDFLMYDTA